MTTNKEIIDLVDHANKLAQDLAYGISVASPINPLKAIADLTCAICDLSAALKLLLAKNDQ